MKAISINELIKHMNLEIIYMPTKLKKIEVAGSEASRPGLQLTGFFKVFSHERIQVIGVQESEYILSLSPELRRERLRKIFEYPIPAMVITGENPIFPEILEFSKEYERALFKTELPATKFISKL